jgi:hypothetical protein
MGFEASRKHGSFDTRWPSGSTDRSDGASSSPPLLAADAAAGLDWDLFATHYVGGRRRHDLRALCAYAAYKRGREWGSNGHPKTPTRRLRVVPNDPVPPAIEAASDVAAQRLLAAVAAIQTWEGEGGYAPKSDESGGERYG